MMNGAFKTALCLLFFIFPLTAWPCPICLEALDPANPRLVELVSQIESEGAAIVPKLRGLAADPDSETALRTAAARHLGIFQDRESLPLLRSILLEILNPESTDTFGEGSATSSLRDAAAEALGAMGDHEPADLLWGGWNALPADRRIEIPRLLSQLRDPLAQTRQIEILRGSAEDSLAFQLIVELRRTGTAAAVPAMEKQLEKWRMEDGAAKDPYVRRDLNRIIHYTESTIRVLRGR